MTTIGLLARIEAKPEHAEQVGTLLRGALQLAEEEEHTVTWFAFRQDATTFGIFDTFEDEEGRKAHLEGRIAAALAEAAPTMLAAAPDIRPVDLLAVKLP
ncbi:putative quinol monooxygenase [Streptomyces albidus (ex Kaewkla and Franco 2022)]|uniref:putative quinol monooxygenase n=1 Tax=Streptomyces albidus (ex Kaewkla and Franco 2022) TaxID=722709 RepID=UPI0015EFDA86|nr:antibiotic biosynthesis monooxygenase [Streptomyces albidus (ex Kaewkla and Franco 2022)]